MLLHTKDVVESIHSNKNAASLTLGMGGWGVNLSAQVDTLDKHITTELTALTGFKL